MSGEHPEIPWQEQGALISARYRKLLKNIGLGLLTAAAAVTLVSLIVVGG